MKHRDASGRFARRPEPVPVRKPQPIRRFRVRTLTGPRSDWLDTYQAAHDEAVRLGLASFDQSRREHYLAVPVSIESRDFDA